jgi:hypothetical protein
MVFLKWVQTLSEAIIRPVSERIYPGLDVEPGRG